MALAPEPERRYASAEDRLRVIAELGSNLCSTMREPDAQARGKCMQALIDKFGKLQTAIEHATLKTPLVALREEGAPPESDRKATLMAGIQDIANALVSDYRLAVPAIRQHSS